MIIGLDGHTLSDKEKYGVSSYVFSLATEMAQLIKRDQMVVYAKDQVDIFEGNPLVSTKILKAKFGWTQWRLSLEFLTSRKPDVMLFPAHSISRYAPMKKVVAIHDLAFYYFPQYFTKKDLFRLKTITEDAVNRADAILVPSTATKNDLNKLFPNHKKPIFLIPLGYDKSEFYPRQKNEIENVRQKYSLGQKYFYYAGSFQPRKNLPTLVKAFESLAKADEKIELVLSGGGGWMSEDTINAIKGSPAKDKIRMFGYVDKSEMPVLYSGATAFVMPSLYEGFGIPMVEAMACGCPIIYANNSSLPEVAGRAGYDFDGLDHRELTDKLKMILDPKNENKQRELSLKRAEDFSWNKTAMETLSALRKIYEAN